MHIPDGYLSPTTCAALYGASAPFWAVALRKTNRLLHTKLVPRLALFAAFSFVIMMFNLPLPGGTTGHAVGIGVAAAVLGPWGAIVAISTALTIQAVFFGDGGVLALGANCFNMAIMGPLVAWGLYRVLAGKSELDSKRRVVAAAVASYVAINVSALLAAVEFGIQPMWFHDGHGTPLYAPYPLSISIPAMVLPHLAVAGVAEALFTAGLLSWLQRLDPEMLRRGSGVEVGENRRPSTPRRLQPVWIGLAICVLLTPLGLLATGSAWGEWAPADFKDPVQRKAIAAGSLGHKPPVQTPVGMARHAEGWSAPLGNYAPKFVSNEPLGYVLSAALGTVLIAAVLWGGGALTRRRDVAG